MEPLSLYASYSLSYQPRAGAQLSSLNLTNEALDPEEFTNYEVGAKWDFVPGLAFTAAVYHLERTNVAIADPLDPTHSILVDGQRVKGVELGIAGNITSSWSVMGAYAYQDGEIVNNQTATVLKGARLAALPENTFSLWNRYDFNPMWGVGLGSSIGQHARRDGEPGNACSECHAPGVHTRRCRGLLCAELTPARSAQRRESLR